MADVNSAIGLAIGLVRGPARGQKFHVAEGQAMMMGSLSSYGVPVHPNAAFPFRGALFPLHHTTVSARQGLVFFLVKQPLACKPSGPIEMMWVATQW